MLVLFTRALLGVNTFVPDILFLVMLHWHLFWYAHCSKMEHWWLRQVVYLSQPVKDFKPLPDNHQILNTIFLFGHNASAWVEAGFISHSFVVVMPLFVILPFVGST